jgi:hypothetical protein
MRRPRLPKLLKERERRSDERSCPAHRAWVRRHRCCVPECSSRSIECAHVRTGTDGGLAVKPSDRWTLSLCREHHREQHQIGERAFQRRYEIDLYDLAVEFARRSPHLRKLLFDGTRTTGGSL